MRNILQRPAILVSLAWIIPAILGAINEVAQQRLDGVPGVSGRALLFGAADWLLFALFTPIVFAFSRRWPLRRDDLLIHGALHIALALLFSLVWAAAGTLLKALLMPEGLWGGPTVHFIRWLFITLPVGTAVYLGLVGTEHAFRYFMQSVRLSEQLSAARLAALQATINPHFFFNTLNSIAVLVRDGDRVAATRIIEQFSDVMRHALRSVEHEVTLEQELEVVRQYVAIETARFSDRLRPSFDVDPSVLSALVPPFALQNLVENAIRHGVASAPEAGEVTVVVRRDGDILEMSVMDDGPGITGDVFLPARGVFNTRERLQGLYGQAASLTLGPREPRGTTAVIRLPLHFTPVSLRR